MSRCWEIHLAPPWEGEIDGEWVEVPPLLVGRILDYETSRYGQWSMTEDQAKALDPRSFWNVVRVMSEAAENDLENVHEAG